METFVVGYIDECWVGPNHGDAAVRNRLFRRWNRQVLRQLPVEDEWPPLVRTLFAWTEVDHFERGPRSQGGFRGGIIHFGGRFRQIEERWQDWLPKFESLLRRLYCVMSVVFLDTEVTGRYRFEWRAEHHEGILSTPPTLPKNWKFRGPFRDWADAGPSLEMKEWLL